MSKVYSFRLDEKNPREAQARAVIDAWVSKGYSLRYKLVDVLIAFHNNDCHNNELEILLEKITHILESRNEGGELVKDIPGIFPEEFIGSISKSVKSGIRIE